MINISISFNKYLNINIYLSFVIFMLFILWCNSNSFLLVIVQLIFMVTLIKRNMLKLQKCNIYTKRM